MHTLFLLVCCLVSDGVNSESVRSPLCACAHCFAPVVPNLKMQPWPVDSPTPGILQDVELGQVGGVAVSPVDGRIYVFHRGPRVWNSRSFDISNNFNRAIGPIPMDTVLVMDQNTGKVLAAWGKNLFYMPHGITVDGVGNVWVTDVGLHQVITALSLQFLNILVCPGCAVVGLVLIHES